MTDSATHIVCAEQLGILNATLEGLPTGAFVHRGDGVLAATMGAHVRHLLDHYDCLLDNAASGEVDYACRSRDARCETDARFAMDRIAQLIQRLRALKPDYTQPLKVRHEPGDPALPANESSLGRELEFLHSHTAHHFALLAVIMTRQGISLPVDFGLARSTVRHRAANSGERTRSQPRGA